MSLKTNWVIACSCSTPFLVPERYRPARPFFVERVRCPQCLALYLIYFDEQSTLHYELADTTEEDDDA